MFREKLLKALDVYLDKLDGAIDELKRARAVAINEKASLLRGMVRFDSTPIPSIEAMVLQSAIMQSVRVDAILSLATENEANEKA